VLMTASINPRPILLRASFTRPSSMNGTPIVNKMLSKKGKKIGARDTDVGATRAEIHHVAFAALAPSPRFAFGRSLNRVHMHSAVADDEPMPHAMRFPRSKRFTSIELLS
jgi:hypothetical protein